MVSFHCYGYSICIKISFRIGGGGGGGGGEKIHPTPHWSPCIPINEPVPGEVASVRRRSLARHALFPYFPAGKNCGPLRKKSAVEPG